MNPLAGGGIPHPAGTQTIIANNDIKVTVIIKVEQPDSIVATVGGPQRLSHQKILVDSLLRFTES